MRKILFIILFLCGLPVVQSQEIIMDLPDFTSVQITNGLEVELVKSDKNRAVIRGQRKDQVQIDETSGVLSVKLSISNLWREDNTKIIIYFKEVDRIEAKQKSRIHLRGTYKNNSLRIRLQEGSTFTGNLELEEFYTSIVTGSHMEVSGLANRQEIEIKTKGEYWGENLKGKNVKVNVSSSGTANIFAREYVDAKVKAGGQVYIYGDPANIDQEIVFGGSIKKIN